MHALLTAAIFVAGLAAGVAGIWWIGSQLNKSADQGTALKLDSARRLAATQNAGELAAERWANSVAAISSLPEKTITRAEPQPSATISAPAVQAAPARAPTKEAAPDQAIAAATAAPKPSQAARKTRRDKPAPLSTASAPIRKERIREIDRVRTQAFTETRTEVRQQETREAETRRRAPIVEIGPRSERKPQLQLARKVETAYSRCERRPSLIEREQCKWEVCGDRWGQGSCPSFDHKPALVF